MKRGGPAGPPPRAMIFKDGTPVAIIVAGMATGKTTAIEEAATLGKTWLDTDTVAAQVMEAPSLRAAWERAVDTGDWSDYSARFTKALHDSYLQWSQAHEVMMVHSHHDAFALVHGRSPETTDEWLTAITIYTDLTVLSDPDKAYDRAFERAKAAGADEETAELEGTVAAINAGSNTETLWFADDMLLFQLPRWTAMVSDLTKEVISSGIVALGDIP